MAPVAAYELLMRQVRRAAEEIASHWRSGRSAGSVALAPAATASGAGHHEQIDRSRCESNTVDCRRHRQTLKFRRADVGNVRAWNIRSVSTARTGPATIWREDQRLRCAIGFGVQNTTFCTAGQRPHADPPSAHNGGYACGGRSSGLITERVVGDERT
jgi:hypothetical protein